MAPLCGVPVRRASDARIFAIVLGAQQCRPALIVGDLWPVAPGPDTGPAPTRGQGPLALTSPWNSRHDGGVTSKIVVGVDGSAPSERAVRWGAAYAQALDAEVVVVHAIEIPVALGLGPYYAYPGLTSEQRDELRDAVVAVIGPSRSRMPASNIGWCRWRAARPT